MADGVVIRGQIQGGGASRRQARASQHSGADEKLPYPSCQGMFLLPLELATYRQGSRRRWSWKSRDRKKNKEEHRRFDGTADGKKPKTSPNNDYFGYTLCSSARRRGTPIPWTQIDGACTTLGCWVRHPPPQWV